MVAGVMTEKPDENVPKIDRRTRLAALARYVRVFTAPGFEFATWPEFKSDGERCSPLDECLMAPEATCFIEEAYAYGWVNKEFDWNSWASREEFIAFLTKPSSIAQATEDQMRKILTYFIRKDRFCDGTLAAAFADGHLTALARRAKTLLKGDSKVAHILSAGFEEALSSGVLHPVLSLAREDKDVILEIRNERIDLYCKGNILFQVKKVGDEFWVIQPHSAFSKEPNFRVDSEDHVKSYAESEIPFIKQRIARFKPAGGELEFEQAIVRASNFEKANPDYLIIDRQVSTPGATAKIDLLGILWDHTKFEAFPALYEVKYLTGGGVGEIAEQIEGYFKYISQDFESFKNDLQALLTQKARLGLFPGLSTDAQEKLKKIKIVGAIDKMEIVVALADYSPNAGQGYRDKLGLLPFAKQITIQKLGFAMWKNNGTSVVT